MVQFYLSNTKYRFNHINTAYKFEYLSKIGCVGCIKYSFLRDFTRVISDKIRHAKINYSPLIEHSKLVLSTAQRAFFNTDIMVASYTPCLVNSIRPSRSNF